MNRETILNGISLKSLFDAPSHEFNHSKTIAEKTIILASLNYYGFLKNVIIQYEKSYRESRKFDLSNQLKVTLNIYIKHLNPNKAFDLFRDDEVELKKIVSTLESELINFSDKNYSINKFVSAYLECNDDEYKNQFIFFKSDLKKDIISILSERDKTENKSFQEKYTHLYNFVKNNLVPNYQNNNFSGFMIDMGFDYNSEYLVRYFLENPNKDNYFEAIKYAIEILYFEKAPFHKFVLFRNNFGISEQIQKFYNNNETAIHLNTTKDFQDWEKYLNGENPKQQYLQRWKSLTDLLKNQDVIILAGYKGNGYKIGKIKQNTKFEKFVNGKSVYYLFKLSDIKIVNLDLYHFVQTVLPANVTISKINRKNYSLRKIFPGVVCEAQNFEMDDKAIEIVVAEWLRSKYAPKEFKIKYEILKTGGNNKDVDITGITFENKKLIAQVSDTESLVTIKQKINKLEKFIDCKKIFFFKIPNQEIEGEKIISIESVIEDFRKDDFYKELLNELS